MKCNNKILKGKIDKKLKNCVQLWLYVECEGGVPCKNKESGRKIYVPHATLVDPSPTSAHSGGSALVSAPCLEHTEPALDSGQNWVSQGAPQQLRHVCLSRRWSRLLSPVSPIHWLGLLFYCHM